jgi:hypothetical protein
MALSLCGRAVFGHTKGGETPVKFLKWFDRFSFKLRIELECGLKEKQEQETKGVGPGNRPHLRNLEGVSPPWPP